MALSIFVPIGYITVLVASLSIFSRVYRKRTAQALVREHGQPWFPEGHPERDIYQTLVQAAAGTEANTSAVPDVVLKAALLNRAMADVRRILRMRDDKQALTVLLQKGSIGDETMAKFTMAEKELEAEILDVVSEANTFREGWGQIIFPTASEMVAHLKHKDVYYGVAQQREEEIKRLKEAGKPIPQPTVPLPPLITPAGTSITIQAPQPPAGVNVPLTNGTQEQKLAAIAAALANNKAMQNSQQPASGTVEEVQDEQSAAALALIGDGVASTLEEYTAMSDPFRDDEHHGSGSSDDEDRFEDSDSDVIRLFLKTPTPLASPEAALVQNFVEKQQKQLNDQRRQSRQSKGSPPPPTTPTTQSEPAERKSWKRKALARKRKKAAAAKTAKAS